MKPAANNTKRKSIILTLILLLLISIFSVPALSLTNIEVTPVNTPDGAVIMIVDGMSSAYIYPEFTPYAIDGNRIEKAIVENISAIGLDSTRILEVRAPQTYTEAGHSVLVTGSSDANGDVVGYAGSTIYDSLRPNGYLCFAVLEKGDSRQMRQEQDIVVFDETNSINDPTMKVQVNNEEGDRNIKDIEKIMQNRAYIADSLVDQYPEGSGQRYDEYNRWTIDTATQIMDHMDQNAPEQRYILTLNAGAVDTSGHYRGSDGYIENIKGIDAAIMPIYEKCMENDLVFILTADHGMAFSSEGARGGHQSDKYSVTDEAQLVPLIIHSGDIQKGVIYGNFGQEDIAPTILSVLNIPDRLRFADGEAIPVKEHANIHVSLPENSDIELIQEGMTVASGSGDREYLFLGVKPGHSYTVRVVDADDVATDEKTILVEKDVTVQFVPAVQTTSDMGFFQNRRQLIGAALILLINIAGLFLIIRIYRE